ncbi:MAG: hypothetical protein LUD27_01865 [Clostridia bacterium]|nr:hypothetical protein [Clostridia bacterium]
MPKYYMTFGAGQALEGYVLPIQAKDKNRARAYMQEQFNNHYCTSYSEREWANYKKQATQYCFPIEKELDTIILSEE